MFPHSRNYYQIYRVDHKRNQEQMVAEVEGQHEAEKLVEKYLRNMTASEVKDEISYYRSTLSSSVPKMFGLTSVVTPKPANEGHLKTGQRNGAGD
jgi:hypothetical protein